jgi:hypothetical protein
MYMKRMPAFEPAFAALLRAERETIIRHGAALRVVELQHRLFLAPSTRRAYAARSQTPLEPLDAAGRPDGASEEMHADWPCAIFKVLTDEPQK